MNCFKKFWNWLRSLFVSDPQIPYIEKPTIVEVVKEYPKEEPVKEPEIKEEPKEELPKTKIALIVGHTEKYPGAKNYLGETEYSFNSRIAHKIKKCLDKHYENIESKIFFRPEGNYVTAISKVAEDVGEWKPKISLELHFNSFKTKAYGCEILLWGGSVNIERNSHIADKMTDILSQEFDLKERNRYEFKDGTIGDGVKILNDRERGCKNLKFVEEKGVSVAMLIEPCYANLEQKESKAIFGREDSYAEILAVMLGNIGL